MSASLKGRLFSFPPWAARGQVTLKGLTQLPDNLLPRVSELVLQLGHLLAHMKVVWLVWLAICWNCYVCVLLHRGIPVLVPSVNVGLNDHGNGCLCSFSLLAKYQANIYKTLIYYPLIEVNQQLQMAAHECCFGFQAE